jgi:hypothetical protein
MTEACLVNGLYFVAPIVRARRIANLDVDKYDHIDDIPTLRT